MRRSFSMKGPAWTRVVSISSFLGDRFVATIERNARSGSGGAEPLADVGVARWLVTDPFRSLPSDCYLGAYSSSGAGFLGSRVQGSLGESRHAVQPRGMSARVPIDGLRWNAHPRQTTIASFTSVVVPQSTCQSPSKSWLTRSTG